MKLTWKSAPRDANKVAAAMRRTQQLGPAGLAQLATLSIWTHRLKSQEDDDVYPGITLAHMASLLRNLVAVDSGPLPLPFLSYWLDDPLPQIDVELTAASADDDQRLQQFIRETDRLSPASVRVREQQARLLPLLAEGNEFLVTGALTRIKQTYLARDWKNYFQFGLALDELIRHLQPYADGYRAPIFQFLSDLLIENAVAAHFDPLVVVSCLNWFLVTWSGRDALSQLAERVEGWQQEWPVVVFCVHNRIGRTIRVVQFNSADGPFDKTNRLLHPSGGRSIGSLLAQKDRIRANDEAYFVFPLPDGSGTYRLRVEAGGMARFLFRATTETTASVATNHAYVWTVSAHGTDQVQPLEFIDDA